MDSELLNHVHHSQPLSALAPVSALRESVAQQASERVEFDRGFRGWARIFLTTDDTDFTDIKTRKSFLMNSMHAMTSISLGHQIRTFIRVIREIRGSFFYFSLDTCEMLSIAAIVSFDGRKLPGRWPSAIIIGVQPNLFFWSQIFCSAP